MTETKIKVDKAKLIEAIKARRVEAEALHNVTVAEYPESVAEWERQMKLWLDEQRERVTQHRPVQDLSYAKGRPPEEPKLFDGKSYDRHIAMLEMSPDQTVLVSTSDFGAYLR